MWGEAHVKAAGWLQAWVLGAQAVPATSPVHPVQEKAGWLWGAEMGA